VPPRFHAPDAERPGDLVSLPSDEAQHLTRVLRLGEGAAIRVFNGRGAEFDAVVAQAGKSGVQVRVGPVRDALREPGVAITLAQAVLKADKMDDVVRDAVMLGVVAVQPMVTARSEVSLESLRRGHRQERWTRIAVSSAKQCGRAIVPVIQPPLGIRDVLSRLVNGEGGERGLIFVEPSAAQEAASVGGLDADRPRRATVLVGPEGGWTGEELQGALAICRPVTLGARTLRADAMSIVALTALLVRWGEL
jgi:16S rRNA (uracil1498-N3)-methyltransferase